MILVFAILLRFTDQIDRGNVDRGGFKHHALGEKGKCEETIGIGSRWVGFLVLIRFWEDS